MKRLLIAVPLLLWFAVTGHAQIVQDPTNVFGQTVTVTAAGTASAWVSVSRSGITAVKIVCYTTGTVTTAGVTLQSSEDGSTVASTVIASTNCADPNSSAVTAFTGNYIRINATTFAGSGSVYVSWRGYVDRIANLSVGGSGCTANDVLYATGAAIAGCETAFTYNPATNRLLVDGEIRSGVTTTTADTGADDIVVERAGPAGISILTTTGASDIGLLAFGNTAGTAANAKIAWSYSANRMTIGPNLSGATLRFVVGASTNVWDITATGHWEPQNDNVYDICMSGLRCRTGYFGTGVTVGASAGSSSSMAEANFRFRGNDVLKDGTPTCSGAGCALITGAINSAGRTTTTTTGAASIVITFSETFDKIPSCVAVNETTSNLLRATPTLTTLTLAGTTVSGDTLAWVCIGN